MIFTVWLTYATLASLNIISPGPAILLAISNRMRFGFKSVVLSSLGNVFGLFVLAALASIGLGALLKNSPSLFIMVKIIGCSYMMYLGVKQWMARTNVFQSPGRADATDRTAQPNLSFMAGGFGLAVTNPKPLLFFAAIYPQFIDFEAPVMPQFLLMTLTFMSISFMSLLTYAMLAGRASAWFSQGQRARYFNMFTGAAFFLLGITILFAHY
jgi:homoserine/homoserine lactone efflux protein